MQNLRVHPVPPGIQPGMSAIQPSIREAYARWAPRYPPTPHNPLMRVEQQFMLEQWPDISGCTALDLAAGSGRYSQILARNGAANVVALDFCAPMLAQVTGALRVCASMQQLPFAANTFDFVVSGLALGHATDLALWMREVARVLRDDGVLLYSDFHPDAARMSLTRSFTDEHQQTWTVTHHHHSVEKQRSALAQAGLLQESCSELRVGIELIEPFAGSDEFYARWHGLAIALVVKARKQCCTI